MSNSLHAALVLVSTLVGVVVIAAELRFRRGPRLLAHSAHILLGILLVGNILFVGFLWFNHVDFPLNLDLMEGTVLQHVRRAGSLAPVYPPPTAEFVPFAYNPLFYYLAVPFTWIFGSTLAALRLVAIFGTIGSATVLFVVVRDKTHSLWWALAVVGLFAAAYYVMDAYLDTAHSDSWLLFSVLLGSFIIERNRSRAWNIAGVVILVAGFWFKQHGALFAIGGVLYLTWREGLRRALIYWLVAALLGPGFYLFVGPSIFGTHFHYFTWVVPSQWSALNWGTMRRFAEFVIKSYLLLAIVSGIYWLRPLWGDRDSVDIWWVQFVAALLSGFMGALDAGSSNNVFIPMGAWIILLGVIGLAYFARLAVVQRYRLHLLALFITLGFFAYNPMSVIASGDAQASYADLVDTLRTLGGPVYAPSLGQLATDYEFHPTAHWVALEDMIRGPGRDTYNHPTTRALLASVTEQRHSYILTNYPLEAFPWLAFLNDYYVLEEDFGDRFKPLRVLPGRFDHGWPRYLYRYAGFESAHH